jgi:hypothetical protein
MYITMYLPIFFVGRLLIPPFQIDIAFVAQISMMASHPVRSKARKDGDWT